jgi:CheY-like chemotaxis protein
LGGDVLAEKQIDGWQQMDDTPFHRRKQLAAGFPSKPGMVMKRRILVAEDNLFLGEIIQKELEALKYDVTVASNGLEAVKMATSDLPDFIIMDLTMPGLDGFEAAAAIRGNPKTQAIPLLAVTALLGPDIRRKSLASGFDGCIVKPFTAWELDAAIKKILTARTM